MYIRPYEFGFSYWLCVWFSDAAPILDGFIRTVWAEDPSYNVLAPPCIAFNTIFNWLLTLFALVALPLRAPLKVVAVKLPAAVSR